MEKIYCAGAFFIEMRKERVREAMKRYGLRMSGGTGGRLLCERNRSLLSDDYTKAFRLLATVGLSELFTAVSAGFFGVQILSPFQILWIFLVSGCFPAHLLSRRRLWKRRGRNGKCRDRDAPGASGRSDAICGERDTFPGKWIGRTAGAVLLQGGLLAALALLSYFTGCYAERGLWIDRGGAGQTRLFIPSACGTENARFFACGDEGVKGRFSLLRSQCLLYASPPSL